MTDGHVDHWLENVVGADIFGLEGALFDALINVRILVSYAIPKIRGLPVAKVKALVALNLGPRRPICLEAQQDLLVVSSGKGGSLSPASLFKGPCNAEPHKIRHPHAVSTSLLGGTVIRKSGWAGAGWLVLARQCVACVGHDGIGGLVIRLFRLVGRRRLVYQWPFGASLGSINVGHPHFLRAAGAKAILEITRRPGIK